MIFQQLLSTSDDDAPKLFMTHHFSMCVISR